ncbi:hypothetical protein [Singulisphaera acidiphila]|uniref:Uncharacterized protein n=1 Tax=Singulisphaera acidiphila (strain ATCC BAA-1392 / DSM 18658 / VKM B-2454 / MOB10) TaxID=886293 RepID=L0DQB8_SINAD|nr:hypothetical protein [Singulisphaera acidiphila]AGA31088.1 hypothetical protein Sinac_7033 [Singulisphaera acidiphila DSM 18658]
MKSVGILLFWSFLLPSFGGRGQASDSVKSPQAVASTLSHATRLRRSDGRLPNKAFDHTGLGLSLWDGEDDDDSDGVGHFIAFDAPLTSSHVVDNAPWSSFTFSQTKAVWTSCHRIPLRC